MPTYSTEPNHIISSRNVLIGLNLNEIVRKYKVKHDDPLPTTIPSEHWTQGENLDLAAYEDYS